MTSRSVIVGTTQLGLTKLCPAALIMLCDISTNPVLDNMQPRRHLLWADHCQDSTTTHLKTLPRHVECRRLYTYRKSKFVLHATPCLGRLLARASYTAETSAETERFRLDGNAGLVISSQLHAIGKHRWKLCLEQDEQNLYIALLCCRDFAKKSFIYQD